MPAHPGTPKSIEEFITFGNSTSLLRFIICDSSNGNGGEDASTLIKRLAQDADIQHTECFSDTKRDSKDHNISDEEAGYYAPVDGIDTGVKPESGNDVSCFCFSTPARKFMAADLCCQEQSGGIYIAAAATASLAVLLVDASTGIVEQTRYQAYLLSLTGVKHIILAINKNDLEKYSSEDFVFIDHAFKDFAKPLGFSSITSIPLSVLTGDNITRTSTLTPWYGGPALLAFLEKVEIPAGEIKSFRFPVQSVTSPGSDSCRLSGTIRGGSVCVGDEVMVASSLKKSRLAEIITPDGSSTSARQGDRVALVLEDTLDISRGDILATPGDLPQSCDQFQAKIIWTDDDPLLIGRSYQLKIGAQVTNVQITDIKHVINVTTSEHLAARAVELNEIAVCNLATSKPVYFDAHSDNAATGSFILEDRLSRATAGVGLIDFGLRRADNLSWQAFETSAGIRASMKGQTPSILWFTGLSASGKSTIVDLIDRKLIASGVHTYILDGDNVRHGLNKDLGFTDADRVENIRRVAEVARLMADAGLVVLVSFISPFIRERRLAREIAGEIEFHEVFVDTPLAVCEARDPKGLYAKARAGDLANFTGISSPFEAPQNPDLRLPGADKKAEELAEMVIEKFNL